MDTLNLTIDAESMTAPFEQVRTRIASAVVTGELSPGTKLPTVRQLAADLGLAVNTVARAYRELEADTLVVTRGRRGTFVRSEVVDQGTTTSTVAETARAAAAEYVYTIRRLGLSSQEALRLAENAWSSS